MNDDELRLSYQRLGGSVRPPIEARELVAARIKQRRRRRVLGSGAVGVAALTVVVVIAGAALGGSGQTPRPPDVGGGPMPPLTALSEVTCPGGVEPTRVDYDHPGYATFTAMVRGESRLRGAFSVDLETRRIYLLRDDGTAHTMLSWMGGTPGRWFPSSASRCGDAGEWADSSPTVGDVSGPLSLEVGHCWIEPVTFEGRTWDVVEEDQFGWGGGQTKDFAAIGTARMTGDVVTYVDDSGTWLTLVPEGHPWTREPSACR
jgi:hypothetical protein